MEEKVAVWTATLKTLALVAVKYSQTAYAGFTFCLQNEWQYIQRVVAEDIRPSFTPLEVVIQEKFLPSLIGIPAWEIDGGYCDLLSQSVKKSGMVVRNPLERAPYVYKTSKRTIWHLVQLLVNDGVAFNPNKN